MTQDSSSSSESSSNRSTSPLPLPKPTRRTNHQSSYRAPLGYKVLNEIQEFKVSSLDLSKVKNDQNDLWIIRLPAGVRTKHLENLKLDLKSIQQKSSTNKSKDPIKLQDVLLGNLTYEVFIQDLSMEDFQKFKNSKLEPESQEVSRLSILIPNHQSNQSQLYQSTKPISKVLFFRRKLETEPTNNTNNPKETTNPLNYKRIQPIQLETRLIPYGAQTDGVSYEYPLRSEEDSKLREAKLDSKRKMNDKSLNLKSNQSQKKKIKIEK
ncbi:uncharacterized protein MELLADRAFT_112016 [Melampsora larici-populina 98AG31]|uniref:Uncharacterized protein n=1 Tax=Melampsora larici-populina (strain 98AG31 / pathotype 3-4-7) TaxID=747676 RepID=F4S542_MELLP|nr:uncharacterized protein MELLADRAFT_112016 [Melampsora larici-populina 98AG31]EGG00272.1 hypothetical protein MELLADRAFT_112016 [Melampsora larici-populina 98AG31]